MMKPLVVIPARGGSKGVTSKNTKPLSGKPLIYYTINPARKVFKDEDIIISSDDDEIINYSESLGLKVPFKRPDHLSTDSAGTYEVLLHAIDFAESHNYLPDTIILLQPTSPLRTTEHIKEALFLFKSEEVDMVVSVKETKSNPYYVLYEENNEGFLIKSKIGEFTRRQDCPKVWELNGAIYIININSLKVAGSLHHFKKIKKYPMDEISSHDIDTPLDFALAELLIQNRK